MKSLLAAAMTVGTLCLSLAFLATWKMEETFHKDLDYLEQG